MENMYMIQYWLEDKTIWDKPSFGRTPSIKFIKRLLSKIWIHTKNKCVDLNFT